MPAAKKDRSKKKQKQKREYLSPEEKVILKAQLPLFEAQPDHEKREAFLDGPVSSLIQELHKDQFSAAKLTTDQATMDTWAKKKKVCVRPLIFYVLRQRPIQTIRTWFKNHRTTAVKPIKKLRKDTWKIIYIREHQDELEAEMNATHPGIESSNKQYIGVYKRAQKSICDNLDDGVVKTYKLKAEVEATSGPPLEEKRK